MRDAVIPVQDEIRAGLVPHLPDPYADGARRGPAARRQRPHERPGPGRGRHRAGPAAKARKLRSLDAGELHHPGLGATGSTGTGRNRRAPGWFTGPAEAAGPRVRDGSSGHWKTSPIA